MKKHEQDMQINKANDMSDLAKPLVWNSPYRIYVSGDYVITTDCDDVFRATYNFMQLFVHEGKTPKSLYECKAACEAHHQAQFLEQLE